MLVGVKWFMWTIYCHTHIATGRHYVGLTKKTMLFRWNRHVYDALKRGRGVRASHFASAIRKYGKDAFSHEVLETCGTLEEANAAEESWIERLDTRNPDRGFNLMRGGEQVVPKVRRNPWDDPAYRERMTAFCQEMSSRPEVKAKVGAAARGRVFSDETRRKITENLTGRTHVTSPETRAKLSAALKRHFSENLVSEETRRKMSESSRGRVTPDETRARVSAAGLARSASVVRTHC